MKLKNFIFCFIIFVTLIFPSFSSDDILIYVGEEIDMNTYINSDLDFSKTADIAWSSGNTQIATVNSNGILTGISPGNVIIVATSGKSVNVKSKLFSVNVSSMIDSFEIVDQLYFSLKNSNPLVTVISVLPVIIAF